VPPRWSLPLLGLPGGSAAAHDPSNPPTVTTTRRFGEHERRSQCQIIPSGPCLILARKFVFILRDESCQAVDLPSNTATVGPAGPCNSYLCKSAGQWTGRTPAFEAAADSAGPPKHSPSNHASAPNPALAGSPFKSIPGRGGTRNRADRRSMCLSRSADDNLAEAASYAAAAGMPFNRMTTLHWERAGVADPLAATGRFIKAISRLTRSRGYAFACLWVRENGPTKGEHVHILWHGPSHFPDLSKQLRRIMTGCGARWAAGVRDTRAIGRGLSVAASGGEDYRANLDRGVEYVCKGADGEVLLALGREHQLGGEIVGKRCGVSRNIDREARTRGARAPG
jgi:hypothetical protein